MTKKLFWFSTSAFWLVVTGLWLSSLWLPDAQTNAATTAERRISKDEVERHARAADCWMIIRGVVYDFSSYIASHPTRPEVITNWCGKEATKAYETKLVGRPHSPYANELLAKHRIGSLDSAAR